MAVVTSLDFLVYLHGSLLPVLAEQRLILAPSATFPHLGLYGSDLGCPGGTLGGYQLIEWDSHETWIGIKVMFKLFISYF